MPAGQVVVERHLDGGGVFAEDPLQAVGDFLARAIGERAQADRAELARVDAFEQLPEAALQAVVGFADVLQDQDRPRRGVQAAECAGHAGQGGEVAADQRAFDALLVSAEVLHREFMVDSGQQAADRGQRG